MSLTIKGKFMPITKDDVKKIAELARLELTPEETESFTVQLDSILGYIDKLSELNLSEGEPMSHSIILGEDSESACRDDLVSESLGQEVAVANAPDTEAGYFKVPKVIGG
jgi:aspartyl-tRNA(Asn)/glutamyl-tRNA(Gln) amidotransferase subunit C